MVGYLDGVGECGERDRKISMQQSPAVLCIFNMEKAAGVAVATNPKSAQSAHPSVPHPPTTLAAASPPLLLLLPGHLSADRELRTQTGLLRGAGIRLRPGIMSKAPLSIPEQEHVPADTGAQQTVFPLLLPLRLYSIAAIYFVLKPLRRWFVSIVC